jgi:hypothetical protein
MNADGPFVDPQDQNKPGEPHPYGAPPLEMFPDVRNGPQ